MPTEETPPTTTATDQDETSTIEAVGDKAKDIIETVDSAIPDPVDLVIGRPIEMLNEASVELAGSAFGDLAEIGTTVADPAEIVIAGLTVTFHMIAGFVAFAVIATSIAFLALPPRRKFGARLSHLGSSSVKFLLVSSLGVTIGVTLIELSNRLTGNAIDLTLPESVNVEDANIYDAALAVVIVPLVGVAFEFQKFFVGILIAFWPLAAAVSILKSFKHALPVFSALLAANVIWPPLSALAIGRAFAVLPSVGAASWWCAAAVLVAPLANAIALAARAK